MAQGRQSSEWKHTSALIANMVALVRGGKADWRKYDPTEHDPEELPPAPLKGSIEVLKAFLK